MKNYAFCGLACLLCGTVQADGNAGIEKNKPNILLIVVDDMGFSDIQPCGGEINTPNINRLSENGVLFTRFHSSSLSAPARAMLLTGVDNHQNGLGVMPPMHAENQYMRPGYEGFLNDKVTTLPEVLKAGKYYTCMAGKWHLGAQPGHTPAERGFDRSFALMAGGAGHFCNSFPLSDMEMPVTFYAEDGKRVDRLPDDFYSTRYYTDRMIGFLRECPENKPFFAYLAFTAPHDPLHIIKEWSGKYRGKYDCGYEKVRSGRLERQKQMGIVSPDVPSNLRMSGFNKNWDELSDEEKKEQSRKMEIYAAMVEYVDYSIGRVMQELELEGKMDNTLVIFMSDNGANPKDASAYPGNELEAFNKKYDNSLTNYGEADSFVSLGGSWAEVCNTPYSLYKMTMGEGGICTPLIISGKGIEPRVDNESLLHVCDLFPTILEYTKTAMPEPHKAEGMAPLYGKSFAGSITGNGNSIAGREKPLCFEMLEDKAVAKGEWKAVLLGEPYGNGKDWKLFNIKDDVAEKHDLSGKYPELLQELIKDWEEYARSVGYIRSDGSSALGSMGATEFYKYGKE